MEFIIDETMIKIDSTYMWIWVAIEPESKEILGISVSKERNMLIAERFISSLTKGYGKHSIISTDGGTWYPQACQFLKLNHHHIHSSYEKSLTERTMQYIKDRTESFDDYFPCRKDKIQLSKVCSRLTNDKYPKLFSTSFLNRYILIQCCTIIFIMPGLAHHGSKKVHRPTFFIFVKV